MLFLVYSQNKKLKYGYFILLLSFDVIGISLNKFSFDRSQRSTSRIFSNQKPRYFYTSTTITEPGIYALLNSIEYDPTEDNQSCITIDSDNVVVDFNLKSIYLKKGNTKQNINGVYIKPNRKNIIIRNGSIVRMNRSGILVGDHVEVLNIYDTDILYSTSAGIILEGLATGTGISNVSMSNIVIQDIENTSGAPVYSMLLQYVKGLTLEQCACHHNESTLGATFGIKLESCSSILVKSCVIGAYKSSGPFLVGFDLYDCKGCSFFDSAVIDLVSTNTDLNSLTMGFNIDSSRDIFLQDCSVISNSSTYTCAGYHLTNCSYSQLSGCESYSNVSSAGDGIGFVSFKGKNNLFEKCKASTNNGNINGIGFGFYNSEQISCIRDCESRVNNGLMGTSYGIVLNEAFSCIINANSISSHSGGVGGYGIYDSASELTNNIFLNNVTIKNSINFNLSSTVIPIYSGDLNGIPGPFANVSIN